MNLNVAKISLQCVYRKLCCPLRRWLRHQLRVADAVLLPADEHGLRLVAELDAGPRQLHPYPLALTYLNVIMAGLFDKISSTTLAFAVPPLKEKQQWKMSYLN